MLKVEEGSLSRPLPAEERGWIDRVGHVGEQPRARLYTLKRAGVTARSRGGELRRLVLAVGRSGRRTEGSGVMWFKDSTALAGAAAVESIHGNDEERRFHVEMLRRRTCGVDGAVEARGGGRRSGGLMRIREWGRGGGRRWGGAWGPAHRARSLRRARGSAGGRPHAGAGHRATTSASEHQAVLRGRAVTGADGRVRRPAYRSGLALRGAEFLFWREQPFVEALACYSGFGGDGAPVGRERAEYVRGIASPKTSSGAGGTGAGGASRAR